MTTVDTNANADAIEISYGSTEDGSNQHHTSNKKSLMTIAKVVLLPIAVLVVIFCFDSLSGTDHAYNRLMGGTFQNPAAPERHLEVMAEALPKGSKAPKESNSPKSTNSPKKSTGKSPKQDSKAPGLTSITAEALPKGSKAPKESNSPKSTNSPKKSTGKSPKQDSTKAPGLTSITAEALRSISTGDTSLTEALPKTKGGSKAPKESNSPKSTNSPKKSKAPKASKAPGLTSIKDEALRSISTGDTTLTEASSLGAKSAKGAKGAKGAKSA